MKTQEELIKLSKEKRIKEADVLIVLSKNSEKVNVDTLTRSDLRSVFDTTLNGVKLLIDNASGDDQEIRCGLKNAIVDAVSSM